MHKMVQNLEERLQQIRRKPERRRFLRHVYEQLVPGRKSEKQRPGEYHDFICGGTESPLEFVSHLEQKLREYRLEPHAQRLHEHYLGGTYVPKE